MIEDQAFRKCSSLTDITIPNTVTTIGSDAFAGSNLKSVILPSSMTTIGQWSFYGCTSLISVTIPETVTNIEEEAFANCSKLEDVYCYVERYPSISNNAFENSYIDYITLHVPPKAVKAYSNHEVWGKFMEVVALTDEELGINGNAEDREKVEAVYDLNGQNQKETHRGINLIKMSDGTTQKVFIK